MPIGEGVDKPGKVPGRFSEERIETLNLLNRLKRPISHSIFPSAVDKTLRSLNTLAWGRVVVSTQLPAYATLEM